MAIVQTYKCDICGVTKGEGNGWVVSIHREVITFCRWSEQVASADLYSDNDRTHLCGAACAQKHLQKFLEAKHA